MNNKSIHSPSRFQHSVAWLSTRAGAAALCLLAAGASACSKATPTPEKEPLSPSPSASAAIVSPTASAEAPEPPPLPTFKMEKFAPDGVSPDRLYAVEGALMVVDDFRVGRIVGESIEWLPKKIPADNPALGPNRIDSVVGRWPDGIGVLYSSTNGRAPMPTYFPMTGVGMAYTAGPGGGLGNILGVARVGESTIVAANSHGSIELTTVRGTAARKFQTPEQAGCKEGEVRKASFGPETPAITPEVIESSPAGTLVSLGLLCEKRGPAAEVWDKAGKSRIIDLSRWWSKISYWPKILKGNGDELWAFTDGFSPVLHYVNGEFEALPLLERVMTHIFASPDGKLFAHDGQTIHRYENGKWAPIGRFADADKYTTMAMDEKETIWVSFGGVHRLRPEPGAAAPLPCSTPFVYLYEVSSKNEKNYSYPGTRKGLSSFAEVDSITLVEFEDGYKRRLGIKVTSKAQGEAVIAHLRETMKEESPRLMCFNPPKEARKIDMDAKK